MKVQRYVTGRSNVGMLEQGRAALRSPGEVAAEAAAPYEAVAGVAGAASELLLEQQKLKNSAIDAEDTIKTERSVTEFNADKKRLQTEIANDPNATADDYEAGIQALIKDFTNRGEFISDRNREAYMERVGFISNIAIEDALLESNIMRVNKSTAMLDESISLSVLDERFDDAEKQVRMGFEQGLYQQAEADEKLREIQDRRIGKELGAKYKEAVNNNKGDEFLLEVSLYQKMIAHHRLNPC